MAKKDEKAISPTPIEEATVPTKAEIIADPVSYKARFSIPDNARLAWNFSELPRYFKQNESVLFKDSLPISKDTEYTTPIWYQTIAEPADVEILEQMNLLRQAASVRKLQIVN